MTCGHELSRSAFTSHFLTVNTTCVCGIDRKWHG
jgi:hypothetical protein